jgi:hypothetical protein
VRVFTRAAISTGELTIEHVPPEAQGGRWALLTCKWCNNEAGGGVDNHATRSLRMLEIRNALLHRDGDASGGGEFLINGHGVKVEYEMSGDTLTVRPRGKPPHPRAPSRPAYDAFWHGPGLPAGETMQFSPDHGYYDWLARVGFLRTAYLAACVRFGLEYALHPRLAEVRAQLRSPHEKLIDGFMVLFDSADRRSGREMVVCEEPAPTLLVRVARRGVLLPQLHAQPWAYPYPMTATSEHPRASLHRCRAVEWPRRMDMALDFRDRVTPYRLADVDDPSPSTAAAPDEEGEAGRWVAP